MDRLQVAEVDAVWEHVRHGLQAIATRQREPWTPEQIRDVLRAGEAQLLVVPEGFVIWQLRICPYSGDVTFWVWLAYGRGIDLIAKYEPQLLELARLAGAKRMAFSSSRQGYQRRMRRHWRQALVEYERDV